MKTAMGYRACSRMPSCQCAFSQLLKPTWSHSNLWNMSRSSGTHTLLFQVSLKLILKPRHVACLATNSGHLSGYHRQNAAGWALHIGVHPLKAPSISPTDTKKLTTRHTPHSWADRSDRSAWLFEQIWCVFSGSDKWLANLTALPSQMAADQRKASKQPMGLGFVSDF